MLAWPGQGPNSRLRVHSFTFTSYPELFSWSRFPKTYLNRGNQENEPDLTKSVTWKWINWSVFVNPSRKNKSGLVSIYFTSLSVGNYPKHIFLFSKRMSALELNEIEWNHFKSWFLLMLGFMPHKWGLLKKKIDSDFPISSLKTKGNGKHFCYMIILTNGSWRNQVICCNKMWQSDSVLELHSSLNPRK